MRHLSCATGQPLPATMVRAAMLLRLATFATGCSAVRPELVDALADLLNRGVIPVVPRYGSVGASGDLMPSAYVARALIGMGEVEYQGRRIPAEEALAAAGLKPITFAPKEGLALINGTTMMTAAAALLWVDRTACCAHCSRRSRCPSKPCRRRPSLTSPGYTRPKGIRARSPWPRSFSICCEGAAMHRIERADVILAALRAARSGAGLGIARRSAREYRARDQLRQRQPADRSRHRRLYKAGNFYGGHIARLLDTWKIDFAILGNWANALMALLVDDRFNAGCRPTSRRTPASIAASRACS